MVISVRPNGTFRTQKSSSCSNMATMSGLRVCFREDANTVILQTAYACTELRGRMHALIDAVAHMQDLVVTFHRYQWVDSMDTTGLLPVDECPLAVARPGALRRWAPAPRPGRVDRDDTICYQCTNSNRACQCANMRSRNRALGDAIGCLNAFIGRARSTYRPRSPDQPSVTLIQHTIDMLMRECPLDWTTEQDGQTLFQ